MNLMKADKDLDPAEDQARRLEDVGAELAELLRQPGVAQRLKSQPGEGEWSVMQVLGHLAEMIPYWLDHCRRIIQTTDKPLSFGRKLDAPERLAGVEHGAAAQLDQLLPQVENEIGAAALAFRGMSPAERGKTGLHIRDGEISVAQIIDRFIVAHAEEHLDQVRAILERNI